MKRIEDCESWARQECLKPDFVKKVVQILNEYFCACNGFLSLSSLTNMLPLSYQNMSEFVFGWLIIFSTTVAPERQLNKNPHFKKKKKKKERNKGEKKINK
eukprot:TRINITY_DN423_c0_g1_i1.p2 TRINITY_DN423_c0_g1~~TRINITY_DN423_c0_g1_i1.p2  ORF type:complete len:101 (+),score=6.29 TRINITY_DN423_c0_g1_i1:597-899(+)